MCVAIIISSSYRSKKLFKLTIFTLVKPATILLLAVIIFISLPSFGQQYNYQQYNLKDGLAGLTVYSIAQDHDGFLWIGTETGLSRFDGKNFKNYTVSDGLPDNEIIKVFVDSKNRIWILPFTYTVCYFENGKLHTKDNDTLLQKIKMNSVAYYICENKNGEIAILTETRVILISDSTVSIIRKTITQNDEGPITALGINNTGDFCVMAPRHKHIKSFDIYNIQQKKLIYDRQANYDFMLTRNSLIMERNRIILPFNNKLAISNPNNEDSIYYPISKALIGVNSISDTTFSINALDTVYLCKSNEVKILTKFSPGSIINCMYVDREGDYWFGTIGNGIYKLGSLHFFSTIFKINNKLPIYSVYKIKDYLYAGSKSGLLWKQKLSSREIEHIDILSSSSDKTISSIFLAPNGKLVLGTGDGVYIFKVKVDFLGAITANIKAIDIFNDTILAAANQHIFVFSGPTFKKMDTIRINRSTCAKKLNNLIYAGTPQGLYTINGKTISYLGDSNLLFKSRISGLEQAHNGNIWVATYGHGLFAIDKNNKVITSITEKDGLTSNMCRCIQISNNFLWVGTDKGICSIDLSKPGNIKTYSSKDGLDCDIINCLFVDADTVYAGTPYGVTTFSVNDIVSNSFCGIKINSFTSEKTSFINPAESIILSPGDNSFTVDYSGISLKSNGDIIFYYRMTGLQEDWQTTKENILQYASLSPGTYQFEIYAVNAFGKKSAVVVLPLVIEKMFYQETWFIFLCSFFIAGLAAYFVSLYIKRIQKKNDEKTAILQKINELEQRALKSQMNPHFVFNCLNSIQQFIFEKDPKESNKFITDFASIIRQTLDLTDKKFISITEERKYLTTYLNIEQARFQNKFSHQITVDENVSVDENIIPPLLLQPFLENSIRHGMRNLSGRKGALTINFKKEGNYLVCTIDDNGIGRFAAAKLKDGFSAEYQSKGSNLVAQRIENLNRELNTKIEMQIFDKIINGNAEGTTVILKLPFEITALTDD